ncbi:MAG: Nramp family divalent metal transporter [Actinomycetota bacterium]|nr:Nramp family divalent metal transporter [Actinomycetota bacterium]
MDYTSRLTADTLETGYLAENRFWSESKIYLAVVWFMTIAGSLIPLSGLSRPIVLLIISSAGGGVVMAFFYSVMLIVLNRRALPEIARLKGWRLPVMAIIAFFSSRSPSTWSMMSWAAYSGRRRGADRGVPIRPSRWLP